jgi:hypothetical protein
VAAAALAATSASLAVTTQNANVCKTSASDANVGLLYDDGAVVNVTWHNTIIVFCPILRSREADAAGFSVWVDGWKDLYEQTTSCSMVSVSYTGETLGWTSFTLDNHHAGTFDVQLTLPQSQVPMWSAQTLVCSLPPSGELWDIEGAL